MRKIKQTLEKALMEAGGILKRAVHQPIKVHYKSPLSLVTKTDKEAERRIIEIIRKRFPKHSILAEESGKSYRHTCKWMIDPVDGTTNFAHRLPLACVSIGFEEDGILKVGGVWNPFLSEWFWAERGKGASLNGKRIRVSTNPTLRESLLVTGFPYDRRKRADYYLRFMKAFMMKTQGIRRLGSAALDLCYVACGRFDGYWEFKLNPWDQAAGALIAREAGAALSDFSGRPMDIYGNQTLVTNGKIHSEMLKIIRKLL
ncbi:MAG: inositol monophosphatase [Candidatus Omnitrophica bacterium]|nr:inositol monophosphatase [Candidatus Omnitrophota bacterium]